MKNILVVMLLLLAACSVETNQPSAEAPASPSPTIATRSGSELSLNYSFEAYPGSQWYGPDGAEVPKESNVINAITGPAHCGWEEGVIMHVGWPLGRDAENISESRQYLRDPHGVFPQESVATAFDGDVNLPKGAEATGYRTDFMELWLDPEDDRGAYLVFADHVERWPRAKEIIACA